MTANGSQQLKWSLVISTYNREETLLRCLRLGAEQTRPPSEIVVVDSSTDWDKTRDRVARELGEKHPAIVWKYRQARKRSSAIQRNQGIAESEGGVLFLIDDDSLMYADCAEKIMEVYEADRDGAIVGVGAKHVPEPPDAGAPADLEFGSTKSYGPVAKLVRAVLRADDLFVPYDAEWTHRPIPDSVKHLPIERWLLAGGWGMTFRREVCLREPFDEILLYYAATEDSDMSYRATRHGAYVCRLDARLCHIGARSGRLPPSKLSTLQALNTLVLHRIYTTNVDRGRRLERRLIARRALIALVKDLRNRRLQLPEARGWVRGLRMLDDVFDRDEASLRAWYPGFQQALLGEGPSPKPASDLSPG
jgi:GT2 family glycosyltransferase